MKEVMIPFGAQYYRAPTPLSGEWESDLKRIKDYGFNTIKIWAQWRWNCPDEQTYRFDDLDRIMELSLRNGLRVIINVIFDVAPAWFYRKYPESVMITCDGRRVEPQTTAWRQIGGAPGPCFNHAEGIRQRRAFLEQVISRYKHHPALSIWDLWNEPELTCGILREPVQADMVCYCGRCVRGFRDWLQSKYGSVADLNLSWRRNYAGWEDVETPRDGGTFRDMIDWRTYFARVVTEELRWRVETAKGIDSRTPVMVHTVPMPYFNMVNACSNDYELARLCDIFGNSVGSHPFPAALATTCAEGKPVINSEIHALGGDTYSRPLIPSFNDMKGYVLTPLSKGVKGFVFWQYRPETLGRESPAWGLTDLDGGPTPWLDDCVRINRVLQDNAELVASARAVPARIAVINSNANQVFDWCVRGNVDMHASSVIGAYMAFHDGNLNADVIGIEQLSEQKLKNYQVVYYPFPYYMNAATAEFLKRWVADGGCLISEAFFGAYSEEDGLHAKTVPGFGFTDVFGVREGVAVSAEMFNNAYDKQWSSAADDQYIRIRTEERIGNVGAGEIAEAYYFAEELVTRPSASVLGTFENGKAAISLHTYGMGKAILIGSLPGYAYQKKRSETVKDFICGLAGMGGVIGAVSVAAEGGKVRAGVLVGDGNRTLLIVHNEHRETVNAAITFSPELGIETGAMTDLFTGAAFPLLRIEAGLTVELALAAGAHELYAL